VAVGTNVYFGPYDEDNVGVLDTTTTPNTFSTIDTAALMVTGVSKYGGPAAVGTTVVFAPYQQFNVGLLDTTTSVFSNVDISAFSTTVQLYWGAVAVGTSVFFGPLYDDNVGVLAFPYPPSPPPPPLSPPSSPSSAGDDPTFVGADGLPYEVRGEPWKYFNLLSTPQLSLNAQFLPVPERFVHGKLHDLHPRAPPLSKRRSPRDRSR